MDMDNKLLITSVEESDFCPVCGSSDITKSGRRRNIEVMVQRYRCKVCGVSWSVGGYFKHRYPPYVIASAINYYKGGLSCANVVEEIRDSLGYNLTSQTVLNWLKKADVARRPKSQAKNMDTQINRENIKMVVSVTLFHSSSLTPEKFIVLDI